MHNRYIDMMLEVYISTGTHEDPNPNVRNEQKCRGGICIFCVTLTVAPSDSTI